MDTFRHGHVAATYDQLSTNKINIQLRHLAEADEHEMLVPRLLRDLINVTTAIHYSMRIIQAYRRIFSYRRIPNP